MNHRPPPGDSDALYALVELEVQAQHFDQAQRRVTPILDGLQRRHAELTAEVFIDLVNCDMERLTRSLRRLRTALEGRTT